MNLEELMRYTIKDFFESGMVNIDPFYDMVMNYLAIISNDHNDDVIWDDVESYDTELENCIEGIEANKYDGIIVPEVYEELIDWVGKDNTVDFEVASKYTYKGKRKIKHERYVVKVKNNELEKLLNWCNISYEKNVNYADEAEQIRDEAEEAWKEAEQDARDIEQMRRDSYRW